MESLPRTASINEFSGIAEEDALSPLVSVSVGGRSRQPQRRRIISMSETIANVRRNRLISTGSAIEGDPDQISRGSPGNFHPPLYSSREGIDAQRSSSPLTSRNLSSQRPAFQSSTAQLLMTREDSRQDFLEERTQNFEGTEESEQETDRLIEDSNISGCGISRICDPESLCHRLIALTLMSLLGFGAYFCMDNPGALQNQIKDAMDINTYQFANLYAWYSWPNVILPIVGGYLMDSVFGTRLGATIFAGFIILGQVIFAGGGLLGSFTIMQIGRFVFGIGGESLAVAQNTYAVNWFKGKELNMVFGFQLSFARLGSTVNFQLMLPLYDYFGEMYDMQTALGWTLMAAGLTCVLSFISSLILGIMDKRREVLLHLESDDTEVVHLRDIFSFPAVFWLLSIVCLAYYVAIFPFISLGQEFFMKKFNFSTTEANFINGLIYLLSVPASPILGILIDKTGRNVMYCFIAILITLICHSILAFTFLDPYIAVVIMGFAYSLLASALWPIVALIIPEYQLGTAYGLIQSIQNCGLGLSTMIAGLIVDSHGYIWLEIFFIGWLTLGLSCTLIIWVVDFTGNGYCNMGISQREAFDAKKQFEAEDAARRLAQETNVHRPKTASELRNRYLRKIGAGLPPWIGHSGLNVVMHTDGATRPSDPVSRPVLIPDRPSYC